MEIRIIKSQKGSHYLPFSRERFLCVSDGTKRLGEYLAKRLELYDIAENKKEEIVPNLIKYQIWDIRVLQPQEGCCYFTSCHVIEKNQIKVELYRYQETAKTVEFLYEDREDMLIYASQKKTVVFLLNENYLLIQFLVHLHILLKNIVHNHPKSFYLELLTLINFDKSLMIY